MERQVIQNHCIWNMAKHTLRILIISQILCGPLSAFDYTEAPDGTYVGGETYTMAPDGTYVGGDTWTMAPDGTYIGGETWIMAPDGTYVGGEGWIMAPDGTYVGDNELSFDALEQAIDEEIEDQPPDEEDW